MEFLLIYIKSYWHNISYFITSIKKNKFPKNV